MGKMKETLLNTSNSPSPPAPIGMGETNAFLAYGTSTSANTIVGDLLKFAKGDFVVGRDGCKLPLGTRLIANMDSLEIGWIKWVDNRPADRRMGRVADEFKPPRRNELDDNEREPRDADDDGKPKDPWQFTNNIVLADPDDGGLYTFTTGTKGGLGAIGELSKAYGQAMRQRPNEWPIITLGAGSYPHKDKHIGRVKYPVFEVVDWAPKDGEAPASVTPAAPMPAAGGAQATAGPQKAAARF